MTEPNRLINGRFLHDLDGWTASGAVYSAGDGDDHYGVAVLETGEYIEQAFAVPRVRTYTLHYALKSSGVLAGTDVALLITDGAGNTVVTVNPTGDVSAWTEAETEIGLAPGATYTLRITNTQAEDVKVDDVWLWAVPLTRSEIASRVNTKLARLASDRSLTTTPSGSLTEGDYTYAIDAGLRAVGSINVETDLPDVRYLEANEVDTAIDAVEREMLEQLHRDYATEVDISVGPRRESLSQIAKAIQGQLGDGGTTPGGRVVMRKLTHG